MNSSCQHFWMVETIIVWTILRFPVSFIYLSKLINEAVTWPSLRPKTEKTFPRANFCSGVEGGCIRGWYNKFNFKINFNQCFRKKLNWKGTARVPSAVLHFWSFLISICLSRILKPRAATVESSIFMSDLQQKSIVWTWRRRPLYWIYSYKSQCFSSFAGIVGLTGSDELLSCINE